MKTSHAKRLFSEKSGHRLPLFSKNGRVALGVLKFWASVFKLLQDRIRDARASVPGPQWARRDARSAQNKYCSLGSSSRYLGSGLGRLGLALSHLGIPEGHLGRSWGVPRPSWGHLRGFRRPSGHQILHRIDLCSHLMLVIRPSCTRMPDLGPQFRTSV